MPEANRGGQPPAPRDQNREAQVQATREKATRIFREAMDVSLPNAIDTYKAVLGESSAMYDRTDLGEIAIAEADRHIAELDELKDMLVDFKEHRGAWTPSLRQVRTENGTVVVRMQRVADGELRVGRGQEQRQLSFHVQLPRDESVEDAIRSLSLRGLSPQDVIDRSQGSRVGSGGDTRITINSVRVHRSPYDTDAIKLTPQAGIRIAMRGGNIETYGVKIVGARPHLDEIHPDPEKSFNIPQHAMMIGYVFQLANPPKSR